MAYFREEKRGFTNAGWYSLIRTLLTFLAGLSLLFSPENIREWLLPVIGILLIVDAAVMMLDLIISRTFRKLWKNLIAREVVQLFLALTLIFNSELGFVLVALALAALLFVRGVVELVLFVEVETPPHHRRLLLATTVIFFVSSLLILVDIVTRTLNESFPLLGAYLIVQSISQLRTAYRLQDAPELSDAGVDIPADYVPILSPEAIQADPSRFAPIDTDAPDNTAEDHARFVLLPHLNVEKFRRVMICAPHPDDLEGFCGGLVYLLSGEVTSVVFAGGDKGVWQKQYEVVEREDYIQIRLDESSQAGQLLGVNQIIYMGYFDRGVDVTEAGIERVRAIIEQYQPDLVVTFEYRRRITPYPHHDHIGTGTMVREAAIRTNLDFELLLASTLVPNTFVDVSRVRHIKLAALAQHTTQSQLNQIIFPFFEKMLTRIWGVFAGAVYAEGYRRVNLEKLRAERGTSQAVVSTHD